MYSNGRASRESAETIYQQPGRRTKILEERSKKIYTKHTNGRIVYSNNNNRHDNYFTISLDKRARLLVLSAIIFITNSQVVLSENSLHKTQHKHHHNPQHYSARPSSRHKEDSTTDSPNEIIPNHFFIKDSIDNLQPNGRNVWDSPILKDQIERLRKPTKKSHHPSRVDHSNYNEAFVDNSGSSSRRFFRSGTRKGHKQHANLGRESSFSKLDNKRDIDLDSDTDAFKDKNLWRLVGHESPTSSNDRWKDLEAYDLEMEDDGDDDDAEDDNDINEDDEDYENEDDDGDDEETIGYGGEDFGSRYEFHEGDLSAEQSQPRAQQVRRDSETRTSLGNHLRPESRHAVRVNYNEVPATRASLHDENQISRPHRRHNKDHLLARKQEHQVPGVESSRHQHQRQKQLPIVVSISDNSFVSASPISSNTETNNDNQRDGSNEEDRGEERSLWTQQDRASDSPSSVGVLTTTTTTTTSSPRTDIQNNIEVSNQDDEDNLSNSQDLDSQTQVKLATLGDDGPSGLTSGGSSMSGGGGSSGRISDDRSDSGIFSNFTNESYSEQQYTTSKSGDRYSTSLDHAITHNQQKDQLPTVPTLVIDDLKYFSPNDHTAINQSFYVDDEQQGPMTNGNSHYDLAGYNTGNHDDLATADGGSQQDVPGKPPVAAKNGGQELVNTDEMGTVPSESLRSSNYDTHQAARDANTPSRMMLMSRDNKGKLESQEQVLQLERVFHDTDRSNPSYSNIIRSPNNQLPPIHESSGINRRYWHNSHPFQRASIRIRQEVSTYPTTIYPQVTIDHSYKDL